MFKADNYPFKFAQYPLLFGHRGCSNAAPENTLAAFRKILEYGIPGVELDVRLCKSGELVVVHDSNLKRTTGLDSLIADTDWSEMKNLDAGSWFSPEFTGEKIPLIDDVLDLMGDRVYYDIEIKHWDRKCGEAEQKLVSIINKRKYRDRVMVSAFNPWALREVRKADRRITKALIFTDYHEFPRWLRNGAGRYICHPQVLKPNRYKINKKLIFIEKRIKGYPIIPWTEDDPEIVRKFLDTGVDGIITNSPESMVPLFPGCGSQEK